MRRISHRLPGYCRRRTSAIVRIGGRVHYLGAYGSPGSRRLYDRLVAGWLASGRAGPELSGEMTVQQLVDVYMQERRPKILGWAKHALQPMLDAVGGVLAMELRPRDVLILRQGLAAKFTRTTINGYVGEIKRLLAWAVVRDLLPAAVQQATACIKGLRAGQTEAREPRHVLPVPEEDIEATLRGLPESAALAVRLQLLTGMRPGEVLAMRACDLDMADEVWAYRLVHHKTERLGSKTVYLGKQAQELIRPLLRQSPVDQPLIRAGRGKGYCVEGYRRLIYYHAVRMGVRRWHPHQLRHNYATRVRAAYGVEVARMMLGHRHIATTELYAEIEQAKAEKIACEIG